MKTGFSLVELLAVVVIVGILASVALPQYRNAIEHARTAEAMNVWSYVKKMATVELSAGTLTTGTTEDKRTCSAWLNAMELTPVVESDFYYRSAHFIYHFQACKRDQIRLDIARSDAATSIPANDSLYNLNGNITKDGLSIRSTGLTCSASAKLPNACQWFDN